MLLRYIFKWLFGLAYIIFGLVSHHAIVQAEQRPEDIFTSEISIKYCIDPDWMPYEAVVSGEHIGISSDYLKDIKDLTGFNFVLLKTKSWTETIELLKSGECQLTTMINRSPSRELYLDFSDVYFTAPNVLVSLKDEPFLQGFENIGSRTLAITKSYRIMEYVTLYFPKIKTIAVDNEKDGLNLVASGNADLFVGSMLSVNNYIQQVELYDLKIAGWAGPEDKLSIATTKNMSQILASINMAISQIDEKRRIEIFNKWNNISVIEKADYQLYWKTLLVLAVIFTLFMIRYRSIAHYNDKLTHKNNQLEKLKIELERKNKELEFFSNHDPLTKLYNRNYFNSAFNKNLRTKKDKNTSTSLIIIDIDNFKKINDQFGHKIGDDILAALSKIFAKTVRASDIVARWGGEEFVIMCNQSTINEAHQLCERITYSIKDFDFQPVKNLTCSFGIAEMKNNEPMMSCFERADKALYQAKEQGRNQICTS